MYYAKRHNRMENKSNIPVECRVQSIEAEQKCIVVDCIEMCACECLLFACVGVALTPGSLNIYLIFTCMYENAFHRLK